MPVFSVELGNLGSNDRRTAEPRLHERGADHGGRGRFSVASGDGDSALAVEELGQGFGVREPPDSGFVRFSNLGIRKHLFFFGQVGFGDDRFGIDEKREVFGDVGFRMSDENGNPFGTEGPGDGRFRSVGPRNVPSGLTVITGDGRNADASDAHHVEARRNFVGISHAVIIFRILPIATFPAEDFPFPHSFFRLSPLFFDEQLTIYKKILVSIHSNQRPKGQEPRSKAVFS
jgi:hypothetical protein